MPIAPSAPKGPRPLAAPSCRSRSRSTRCSRGAQLVRMRAPALGARQRRRYPSRIVCLTEETTETLYLLGEGDRVVGVSGYTVRPPEARSKPRVSAFINAKFDKIVALEPDLDPRVLRSAGRHRRRARCGAAVTVVHLQSAERRRDPADDSHRRRHRRLRGDGPRRSRPTLEAGSTRSARRPARFPRRPRVFFEEWDEPLISGIPGSTSWSRLPAATPSSPSCAARRWRRIGSSPPTRCGARSRGHRRLVVRKGGAASGRSRTRRDGARDPRRRTTARLRDQVDLHPAAGTGGADRRRAAAARRSIARSFGDSTVARRRLRPSISAIDAGDALVATGTSSQLW